MNHPIPTYRGCKNSRIHPPILNLLIYIDITFIEIDPVVSEISAFNHVQTLQNYNIISILIRAQIMRP